MRLPFKIIFVTLHILAIPLHLIFIVVFLIYQRFVRLLAKITQEFVGPIQGSGALFLSDAIWSRPHSSIIVGVELNGDMTVEEATNIFQKLYDNKDAEGRICYRELGYYLVHFLGFGFWKEVPDFKISDRIHLLKSAMDQEETEQEDNVSSQSNESNEIPLPSRVEGLLRMPYPVGQPLWDVYLHNKKQNRTLVILRFHHLMADGMSFVKLFYCLTGANKLPETFTKPTTSVKKWDRIANSYLAKLGTILTICTVGFIDYINEILIEQDRNSLHFEEDGKLKLSGNWICSMGTRMDVAELKRASRNLGCSIVHIILVGICNGMEKYFYKYHDKAPIPKEFHLMLPLPVPKHPDMRLVNHWCVAKVHAKFGITSTIAQLDYFKEEMKRCAFSNLPVISALTFKYVCGLLPSPLTYLLSRVRATFTVILSNVVGPQDSRRLGDSAISDMYFWMPIPQESMALAAGVISCNGGIRICLTADKGCIPDRSRLEDLGMIIHEELLNICKIEKSVSIAPI